MPSNSGSCELARLARGAEGALVGIGHVALERRRRRRARSRRTACGRLSPTMRRTCVAVGRGQAVFGEGRVPSRSQIARLAVDQRAVAIEHGEALRHGASVRISWAIAGEPCASSPSATRRALVGAACSARA